MMEQTCTKELDENYKMLDIGKYIAAILVISVHCAQLFPNDYMNYFVQNILGRIAVPFFFISSAYFVRKGCERKQDYIKMYLKRTINSYLMWSIIFIPIGLDWIYQNMNLAPEFLPFALIFGIFHIGTYYHLWYIPAMVFAVYVVDKLKKYFSYRMLFGFAILLFAFGSLETYYGLLSAGWLKNLFDFLVSVIFTTRSGLFYGFIFVLLGFYIYDKRCILQKIVRFAPLLTIISACLLLIEGAILYHITRLDMNFMFMLLPFSFTLFLSLLYSPVKIKIQTDQLRNLSKYYYFIHPIIIVIVEEIGKAFDAKFLSTGIISFIIVLLLTHFLSKIIVNILCKKISYAVIASIFSIVMIGLLCGFIFLVKNESTMIKFEFVPCLWIASSLFIFALISKKRATIVMKSI